RASVLSYPHRARHRRRRPFAVMRLTLVVLAFLSMGVAHALDFPATCRGATAVVTDISGLNSRVAKMTAKHTRGDAISYCGNEVSGEAAINVCAAKFMRERRDTVYQAQADCQRRWWSS